MSNPYFSGWPRIPMCAEISLWRKLRLLFRPKYVAIDVCKPGGEHSIAVFYKTLNGHVYILGEGRLFPKEPT